MKPKRSKIKEISSGNTNIIFKLELSNGWCDYTNRYPWANGSLYPTIRNEGIVW